jgi:glyoxylase-like metal-dependent hydrolase (beta-lactamase superfamily II)
LPLLVVLACGLAWMRLARPRDDLSIARAEVPRLDRSTRTLAPGIHYLGRLFPSAAYAVETSDGLVLIDAGLAPDAGPLRRELAALGLDQERLKAVLLTHAHVDHSGGAASLRATAGARVHAGAGDAETLARGGPREALFSFFAMPEETIHPTQVDVRLRGDETLDFGDARVHVISTPGHTPGSTCYLLERGSLRALFTGDVLMKLGEGDQPHRELAKPLGTYSAYLAPGYRGDARDYLASLKRLRTLAVPDLVLPGHPADDREPRSPCLSQGRWEELLDAGIRDMEDLLATYERDGADFLDGSPKELLPGLYYLGEFSGAAVYGLVTAGKLQLVASPRAPGLLAFVRQRLGQLGRPATVPASLLLAWTELPPGDGLREIVMEARSQVVVPRASLETLRRRYPDALLVAADAGTAPGGIPVTPIPLPGRNESPAAYLLPWAGKSVLLTGRVPASSTAPDLKALVDDLVAGRGDAVDLLQSLGRLEALKPDLWLPAVPVNGQNANLYGDDWKRLIRDNQAAVQSSRWKILQSGG